MAMTADSVVKEPSLALHTQGMVSSQLPWLLHTRPPGQQAWLRDCRGQVGRSGEGDRVTEASAPGWAVVIYGCTTEAARRHRSISLQRPQQHRICILKRAFRLEWVQRRSRGACEGWLQRPRERR